MKHFHHKPIKKFFLEGQIQDESTIPRLKVEYARLVITGMQANGYVPRLDINPDFTIEYDGPKELFYFKLTIYGIYVGKKNSQWILGIDEHKPVYIQKSRSRESSREQVFP